MKKVAIVLCALTPLSAVCADGRHPKKVITACAMDALIERGLMTQNPDGSWTTNENVGSVEVIGQLVTPQGIEENVVNVQRLTPAEIAYRRAEQERERIKREAEARQRQAETRRQEERNRLKEQILEQQRQMGEQQKSSSSNQFSGCSVKAYSFKIGGREATREEKPQWMRDEEDRAIYVACNINVHPHTYRIMDHENDVRPGEFANGCVIGKTLAQVKAMHGIKD